MRTCLSENLPWRWIGCTSDNDSVLMRWPPRAPNLAIRDIIYEAILKDRPISPVPTILEQHKQGMNEALDNLLIT